MLVALLLLLLLLTSSISDGNTLPCSLSFSLYLLYPLALYHPSLSLSLLHFPHPSACLMRLFSLPLPYGLFLISSKCLPLFYPPLSFLTFLVLLNHTFPNTHIEYLAIILVLLNNRKEKKRTKKEGKRISTVMSFFVIKLVFQLIDQPKTSETHRRITTTTADAF